MENAAERNSDFKNDKNIDFTDESSVYVYAVLGSYTVNLTASNNDTVTDSKFDMINVLKAYAYNTNYDINTVSVIDIANNTITATVNVGIHPCGVAVNRHGTQTYVVNLNSNTISIIVGLTHL